MFEIFIAAVPHTNLFYVAYDRYCVCPVNHYLLNSGMGAVCAVWVAATAAWRRVRRGQLSI
jgi:hypothetical protein